MTWCIPFNTLASLENKHYWSVSCASLAIHLPSSLLWVGCASLSFIQLLLFLLTYESSKITNTLPSESELILKEAEETGDSFLWGSLALLDLQLDFPQDILDSYSVENKANIYF